MRLPEDKLVKLLMANGIVVHMYASPQTLEKLKDYKEFLEFKDDNNDHIYLASMDVTGFEILDDRVPGVENAEQIIPPSV